MSVSLLLSRLKDQDIILRLDGDQLKINAPKGAVSPDLHAEILASKSEIITYIKATQAAIFSPIEHVDNGNRYPLSFAQQRLWFLNQYEPDSSAYTIVDTREFSFDLDIPAFEASITEIVRRHSALRTIFQTDDTNQPIQIILPPTSFKLQVIDLEEVPAEDKEEEAQKRVTQQTQIPFDLSSGPLFRIVLFHLEPERHWLLLIFHHIISDGWSTGLFLNELQILYEAFRQGEPSPLPDLAIQYSDFALWQRRKYDFQTLHTKIDFWKEKLKSPLPILELPGDRQRPAFMTFHGATQRSMLPPGLTEKLRQLGNQLEVTPFMLLLAAFKALLFRYSGQEDIIIGTPTANRSQVEIEPLIGLFVNTLAMRTDLSGNPTFSELVARVRETSLAAFSNQEVPFEMIVEAIHPPRDTSHSPIFQIFFILQNTPARASQGNDLRPKQVKIDKQSAKFDLTLEIWHDLNGLFYEFEYNTDLFKPATIDRFTSHYQTLLETVCTNPQAHIAEISLLTAAERRQCLVEWNATDKEYPQQTIQALFESQAARTPQAIAVSDEQGEITYADLNHRANQLARYLGELGVGRETLVGISLPRSISMVISLLAILKAGGAYIPLDPNFPLDRLRYMLNDSGAPLLITQSDLAPRFSELSIRAICLDTQAAAIEKQSGLPLGNEPYLDQLAYVIYTSGSTGRPKGVQVLQRGVVNFLISMQDRPGISETDILLSVTTLSFDIAGLEIYLPLIRGARVILTGSNTAGDGARLRQVLDQTKATIVQATPSTWRMLIEAGWKGDSPVKALVGGEALPPDLAASLLERCESLWNMYGPTETTIWSTLCQISPTDEPITIGRPIANTQVYLLDPYGQPVLVGVPGELYIGGDGVARGYLNRPELTSEKFVPDPFQGLTHSRLYRTGDLARYLDDGRIEFIGRKDDQVKIHGVRIELGEVTASILEFSGVNSAVVVGRKDDPNHPYLAAYVEPLPGQMIAADGLRQFLSGKLPTAMIPTRYVFLDRLPLTPNGKVDFKALPPPDRMMPAHEGMIQPRDVIEAKLIQIWKKILHVDRLGVQDDFFQLGGHSLLAVQMFIQIQETFGVNLPLTSLFQKANIEHLANLIHQQRGFVQWSSLVEIQPSGSKPPLFCIHGLTGDIVWFNRLVPFMDPDQPIWGLQSQGLDGVQKPLVAMEEIAALYIREMQSIQPAGPYYLCGYSFGGSLAFEIARQMEQQKIEVGLLAIIDHASPKSDYYQVKYNSAFLSALVHNVPQRIADILRLRPDQFAARLRRVITVFVKALTGKLRSNQTARIEATDLIDHAASMPAHVKTIIETNFHAIENYIPGYYPGTVTLLRARGGRLFVSHDPQMGWGNFSTAVAVKIISGSHLGLFEESNIKNLAKELQCCLDESQA
jgi:amino acid adenylation domain-containing protein